MSEAWGPPQFQEKHSRSEKAILGALGEFRGILGATLGIRSSILGIRNSTLGMASHALSNTKTTILGATPLVGTHIKVFIFPSILGAFFRELGWSPRARSWCLGRCPSTVRFVFPVLVFDPSKQKSCTRTTSSTGRLFSDFFRVSARRAETPL